MRKLIISSVSFLFIYLSVGVIILVCSFVVAFAIDVNNVIFVKSKLSDDSYSVSSMKFRGQHIGCSAVNKLSEPTMVFTRMLDGAGAISIVNSYVGIDTNKKTTALSVKIGSNISNIIGVIDDKMVIISISDDSLKQAVSDGIVVNNKMLPLIDVQRLYHLVDVCNAKHT